MRKKLILLSVMIFLSFFLYSESLKNISRNPNPNENFKFRVPGDENWSDQFGGVNGVNGCVNAIAVSGSNVYVGGSFTTAGGVSCKGIARWDGSNWHPLGSGVGGTCPYVYAIAVASNGDVYVGGTFATAGGILCNGIARWDGSNWHSLGSGVYGPEDNVVWAIAVSGTNVYVGGSFTTAGGIACNNIARWDGSSWHPLGTGVDGPFPYVCAIAISGSNVYVGGGFVTAGGVTCNGIARWDGSNWHSLGSGIGEIEEKAVETIAIIGNDVYIGGGFTTVGGVTCNGIARWDGNNWHSFGSGVSGGVYPCVKSFAVIGNNIYIGGFFTMVGTLICNGIAKWNGNNWLPLGSGLGSESEEPFVYSIAALGNNIYVGGFFDTAGGKSSKNFGKYSDPVGIEENSVIKNTLVNIYPNPFNSVTTLSYELKNSNNVNLNIYNIKGELVTSLVNEYQYAGSHNVIFNSEKLNSGIYFYRLQVGNDEYRGKMLIVK